MNASRCYIWRQDQREEMPISVPALSSCSISGKVIMDRCRNENIPTRPRYGLKENEVKNELIRRCNISSGHNSRHGEESEMYLGELCLRTRECYRVRE